MLLNYQRLLEILRIDSNFKIFFKKGVDKAYKFLYNGFIKRNEDKNMFYILLISLLPIAYVMCTEVDEKVLLENGVMPYKKEN